MTSRIELLISSATEHDDVVVELNYAGRQCGLVLETEDGRFMFETSKEDTGIVVPLDELQVALSEARQALKDRPRK